MESVFIVTVIGFDNMENRDGRSVDLQRVFSSEKKAGSWIVSHLMLNPIYKGWDGRTYPAFETDEKIVY